MQSVNGLHHITAIAGPAQENLDFYAGILGMRLVKKSVNQDDPGTYHLFYADAEGHPGADLTFFPWAEVSPPRIGHGLAVEVALEVPAGSLEYWGSRLDTYKVPLGALEQRFGDLGARRGQDGVVPGEHPRVRAPRPGERPHVRPGCRREHGDLPGQVVTTE